MMGTHNGHQKGPTVIWLHNEQDSVLIDDDGHTVKGRVIPEEIYRAEGTVIRWIPYSETGLNLASRGYYTPHAGRLVVEAHLAIDKQEIRVSPVDRQRTTK